ncbi:bifunctional [glutamate--ammonia ligase]-adenylyl-L-tyrosine phosphorylase/[glutamate--ammonia-ligase] adenylyltransferase [Colwellia sp. 1_MG-2023]|uniref:bifunctional [glutamate--ammonia ligase]-adenylyl-L-tyrosine phosphorylase/[glutamate--ammonia-ligase] adenylyltransferase n=1 Tax=Colwellia sp. 1_MG-2023 TaxID=3062649 RepID=UPI0026E29142|nr:bifunctional [glutamate--ammonia ligase]-adenylyl-L-tyrosine phosphorylase/[glutamate--ammonia-ligase] adenylyltransferase [Colwellia sp. 1_MG-2023]MDO6445559.1 bifunctional [glutamate--ammonia ligase]-adenylyl-L-tyrosine phosphorylase/[glutamate--ammonia-ligase] adenylyltransferase [Colwellia sp. 1_MG-2023]
MTTLFRKPLLPCLEKQQNLSWQQFSSQYPELAQSLTEQASHQALADFKHVIALSDFVLRSTLQAPEIVINLFVTESVYQKTTPNFSALLTAKLHDCQTEESLHRQLRLFRLEQMVSIATADLVLNIPLDDSLKRLSELADALILGALAWLSDFCYQKWGKPTNKEGEIQPLLVYGMGKLGGKELNFSSDIDLIFVYPETGETIGERRSIDNQLFFTRLGQKLITALHQKTEDGFVYRVDMRLRPFGESGPLVLTFNAMEDYYQEQGRDWERYAMLKARLIGEGKYHGNLSDLLRPFVYRRYIDFSVIDSLRRMKTMIAQEVRRKKLTDNIKLGAGGIREVEFIVQVFQLIRGGRIKDLQQRNLLTVLPILVEHQEISKYSKQVLEKAYRFLRRVENIIQALDDKQTQTLPSDALDQARILHVLGDDAFPSWSSFLAYLEKLMSAVHQEFIVLIGEESPNHHMENDQWVTLWESEWPDEESIEWIATNQPDWQAEKTWQLLVDLKRDFKQRSIGNRGRQILSKLVPILISHIVNINGNETTLERITWLLTKIVTRTAYLELLYENEGALKHLVKLCQASSWLAEHMAKYPILLDELIDPKLLNNPPELSSYAADLRQVLLRIPEDDLEAQMDMLRQFKQAQQLRIAAADIAGVLPITKVSDHLTALAEAIIGEVVNLAWQQISERFGVPNSLAGTDDKGFAVIGYGKMGGFELGYSSDLDLVFIHNCKHDDQTNGQKPVMASQFYAKLAQRIMHIFNTRMNNGVLYELDMRLRPSGNSGVLVVNINTFGQYQQEEAWTWEHQALVRARATYGNQQIVQQYNDIRRQILIRSRDENKLKKEVIDMRNKMREHLDKSTDELFDIKQGRGGLVDIEFLTQYLVLNYSAKYHEICQYSDNIRIFTTLANVGILTLAQKELLIEHYCQLRNFGHKTSLQNESAMMNAQQFAHDSERITEIIQQFLV